jgi:hypothetical protein
LARSLTGLGAPNQMREYVKSGASPAFALNPVEPGYKHVLFQPQPGDGLTNCVLSPFGAWATKERLES